MVFEPGEREFHAVFFSFVSVLRVMQPVLDAEVGDLLEIAEVAGEQRGVAGERDTGDAKVHRADTEFQRCQ